MKNLLTISLSLFYVCCQAQSQTYDNFDGTISIKGQVTWGDTPQEIINAFGQPDDITTEYWEMDEVTATIYHYNNGDEFAFSNNKLENFILNSSNYYVKLGSFQLKIGSHINTIQSKFPNSYANRGNDVTTISLGTGDYTFLLVWFNSSNIITKIEQRIY